MLRCSHLWYSTAWSSGGEGSVLTDSWDLTRELLNYWFRLKSCSFVYHRRFASCYIDSFVPSLLGRGANKSQWVCIWLHVDVVIPALSIFDLITKFSSLQWRHRCQTKGPQAKSGPSESLIWPAAWICKELSLICFWKRSGLNTEQETGPDSNVHLFFYKDSSLNVHILLVYLFFFALNIELSLLTGYYAVSCGPLQIKLDCTWL